MTEELATYLLSISLASSAGIGLALTMRVAFRRLFGSSTAYSVWLLIPTALLAMLLPHSGSSTPIAWRIESVSSIVHVLNGPSVRPAIPSVDWQALSLSVWLTGAALFAAYLTLQQQAFVRSLGSLSDSRCVIRTARSGGGPALLGLMWPKIILPMDFRSRYTRVERLLILHHERTHLRRGDAICNGFLALLRCIFWFNPLVHLASSLFRVDQELACDAAVMRAYPALRRTYAVAMLKTQLADFALPLGCHWRSAQGLKERLQMLTRPMPSRRRRLSGAAFTAVFLTLAGCTTWAAKPALGDLRDVPARTPVQAMLTGSVRILTSASGSTTEAVRDGRLVLPAADKTEYHADAIYASYAMPAMLEFGYSGRKHFVSPGPGVSKDQGHSAILDGHVHITATSPAEGKERSQTITVDTDSAVIARRSDGSEVVQFDKGTVRVTLPPENR
jgi:beta-lactamase regulating signal transducer with metallopeptidase domain